MTNEKKKSNLQSTSDGVGPLIQRDYWAVLKNCKLTSKKINAILCDRFIEFPPKDLVVFECVEKPPLKKGDKLTVVIRMKNPVAVYVIHVNDFSITLGTAKGHPEAGRITFGSYQNKHNDTIFHIRSRARNGSLTDYTGFLLVGDPMQVNTWTGYIDSLSATISEGIVDSIHVEEKEVDQNDEDVAMNSPTFIAQGK